MIKKLPGIALVAAAAIGFSALPAAAAASYGGSGQCNLSANWVLNFSAKWYNTSGSPSRGQLRYVVITSPGKLNTSSLHNGGQPGNWTAYGVDGFLDSGLVPNPNSGTNPYKYSVNIDDNFVAYVHVEGVAPNGVHCGVDIHAKN